MDSTAELFRRQGFNGTGVKQIVAAANAPFGSVYHFFPGGKTQLGAEVIRRSGELYMQLFATIASETSDVCSGVAAFFAGAAQTLEETDYADACPIATVALEVASTNEELRQATAEVFTRWIEGASAYVMSAGVPREQARALALSMLCQLEGGFLFSRALRSTEPLHAAGASAVAAIREAIEQAGA